MGLNVFLLEGGQKHLQCEFITSTHISLYTQIWSAKHVYYNWRRRTVKFAIIMCDVTLGPKIMYTITSLIITGINFPKVGWGNLCFRKLHINVKALEH